MYSRIQFYFPWLNLFWWWQKKSILSHLRDKGCAHRDDTLILIQCLILDIKRNPSTVTSANHVLLF